MHACAGWTLVLAFIWCIVTSVFIVNLLIAKMTTTYELIRQDTVAHRLFRRVSLILEFKVRTVTTDRPLIGPQPRLGAWHRHAPFSELILGFKCAQSHFNSHCYGF